MTTLTDYQTEVTELLHDPNNTYFSVTDINNYINRARLRVAALSQSIRVLAPMTTVVGQEVYTFASANSLVRATAGVNSVIGIFSVSVAWGPNTSVMKPTLDEMIWSEFQAYYRSYSIGLQNFPTTWSKYGQGDTGGSMYLWPIPSTASLMEWDCWCLPITLASSGDTEALPYAWTTPVSYYAAYLAFFNAQRFEDADRMKNEYKEKLQEAVPMSQNPYVASYYSPSDY